MKNYKLTRKQKKTRNRILLAAVTLAVVWIALEVIGLPWYIAVLLFAIPYVIVGYDVLRTAFINLIHGQVFDEKFLMMVATVGAFATGEFPEATAVMLFYQIGELFQSIAVGRSRKSIASLMDIRPDYAIMITLAYAVQCFRVPYLSVVGGVGHYKQTKNASILEI